MKSKRDKSSIKKNIAGYTRKKPTKGEMLDSLTIINELPPVGSKVVVRENRTHWKKNEETQLYTAYEPDPAYRDAWNRPKQYTVEGYSKGIDAPLDKSNLAFLSWTSPASGITFRDSVHTYLVATGSMQLTVIEKDCN